MEKGGEILRRVMSELKPHAAPGATTQELDHRAQELIKKYGADPSFKTVKGYRWATCLPINDQIVHTPPSSRVLQEGDLLTIDIGVYYQSYHTDYADSFIVGSSRDPAISVFLDAGKKALSKAIGKVQQGNRIRDISAAIEEVVVSSGYCVIRNLTGHGIGKQLHEPPLIPGYIETSRDQNKRMSAGMTFAVEVIYAMGTSQMKHEKGDDWSLVTVDGSLAACFEHTIAIGKNNAFILTQ